MSDGKLFKFKKILTYYNDYLYNGLPSDYNYEVCIEQYGSDTDWYMLTKYEGMAIKRHTR